MSSQTSTEKRCRQPGRDLARDGPQPSPTNAAQQTSWPPKLPHGPLGDMSPFTKAMLSMLCGLLLALLSINQTLFSTDAPDSHGPVPRARPPVQTPYSAPGADTVMYKEKGHSSKCPSPESLSFRNKKEKHQHTDTRTVHFRDPSSQRCKCKYFPK